MNYRKLFFLNLIIFFISFNTFSQATFTSGSTAAELAAQISGPGITITNPQITNGASTQVGTFSNGVAGAIEISTDESVFLMIDEFENIEHEILLEDKVENKTYDLANGPVELNLPKGSYKDRFYLKFYKQQALGVDDEILSKDLNVFVDKSSNELVVSNNNNLNVNNVEIYNIIGQKLNSWKINNNSKETRLGMDTFSSAVYIIKVKSDKGTLSKKIIFQK